MNNFHLETTTANILESIFESVAHCENILSDILSNFDR